MFQQVKTGKVPDRLHGLRAWIVQRGGSHMGWGGRPTMLGWLVLKGSKPLSLMHMVTPSMMDLVTPSMMCMGLKSGNPPLWCAYICRGSSQPFDTRECCKAAPLSHILLVPQFSFRLFFVLDGEALLIWWSRTRGYRQRDRAFDPRTGGIILAVGRYNPSCGNQHQRSSPTSSLRCNRW